MEKRLMITGGLTYNDLWDMWVVLDDLYAGYTHPDQSGKVVNLAFNDGLLTSRERLFLVDPDAEYYAPA